MIYEIFVGVVGLVIVTLAVLGYRRAYSRRWEIDFKDVNIFMIAFIIFSAVDIITTIHFTSIQGIEAEGNLLAQVFFYNFGVLTGAIIHKMVFLPIVYGFMLFISNKNGYKTVKYMFLIISVIVPIWNIFHVELSKMFTFNAVYSALEGFEFIIIH